MLRSKNAPSTVITLEDLEEKFPSVSRSECQRYLRSFPQTAADKLQACVEFRRRHGLLLVVDPATATLKGPGNGDDEEDGPVNGNDPEQQPYGGAADDDDNEPDDDDDSRDWRRASDAAIEGHVRESVVASALSRAAAAVSTSSSTGRGSGGLLTVSARLGAFRRRRRERQRLPTPSPLYARGIPQLLRCHLGPDEDVGDPGEGPRTNNARGNACRRPIRDTSDHCILHFLPALIDLSALEDPSLSYSQATPTPTVKASRTFATAIALYLHVKFDQQRRTRHRHDERGMAIETEPDDDERWTIVMDVRPGHGWPNPPAIKMLGFIREAAQLLFELFPGRLHKCVVFPVPTVAANVWKAAKAFLDPSVACRVVVVAGPADIDSPVPTAKLLPHVSRENLQIMEDSRVAAFVETEIAG